MNEKIVLPDFTRWAWASVDERLWWQPLFERAKRTIVYLERESVVAGLRPACWQPVEPTDLVATMEWAHQRGLLCIPTNVVGSNKGNYFSKMQSPRPGEAFLYRCLFLSPDAYAKTTFPLDDRQMGTLLGYPDCCQAAYDATWGVEQVDSTWEQMQATLAVSPTVPKYHTLLRWLGLRLTAHMPCSYHCAESVRIADEFVALGLKLGFKEDMTLIKEVLSWPVEWSRLFGIAEIVLPAVKISTRTDWTPTKDTFSKPGTYNKPESWLWTDNGYPQPAKMWAAHDVLLNSLAELPKLHAGVRVFDLGCGNGLLLRRLTIRRPDVKIGGIDSNPKAIAHAPALSGKWMTGTIESGIWVATNWNPDVCLISVQRLLDMDPDSVQMVIANSPVLFVYGYADTLKDEPLETLTARIGVGTLQMLQKTPEVSVGLLTTRS